MDIDIPPSDEALLAQQAAAVGYDDVARYVTECVRALALHSSLADSAPLDDEALQDGLAMIRESEADIVTGRCEDLRDALRDIADQNGLRIDR